MPDGPGLQVPLMSNDLRISCGRRLKRDTNERSLSRRQTGHPAGLVTARPSGCMRWLGGHFILALHQPASILARGNVRQLDVTL